MRPDTESWYAVLMPPPRPSCCPRCGYDQSGVVESWKESCPLTGVCSECGLEFVWRDVLSEDPQRPRWLFEHAQQVWLLRAAIHIFLCMRPGALWRRVELAHAVNTPRLIGLALLLPVGLYFGLGIERAVGLIISSALSPIAPGSWFTYQPLDDPGLWKECLLLVFWPFGRSGPGMTFAPPAWVGGMLLAAPLALMPLELLLLRESLRSAKVRFAHVLRASIYFAATTAVVWIVTDTAFCTVGWLDRLGFITAGRNASMEAAIFGAIAVVAVFTAWWWRCWVTLHLRMRHGWLTGVLLVTMTATGWLLVLVLLAISRMRVA